jgi:hypothetical protein
VITSGGRWNIHLDIEQPAIDLNVSASGYRQRVQALRRAPADGFEAGKSAWHQLERLSGAGPCEFGAAGLVGAERKACRHCRRGRVRNERDYRAGAEQRPPARRAQS